MARRPEPPEPVAHGAIVAAELRWTEGITGVNASTSHTRNDHRAVLWCGFWDKVPPGTAASILGLTPEQAAAIGLPAGAVQGNYQGGQGEGLLDNAQAPCNATRQTSHGIQAESMRCP